MSDLDLKTGVLGKRLAFHLLRRATFKYDLDRIKEFALLTPDQAVDALFADNPLAYPDGPISRATGEAWYTQYVNEEKPDDFSEEGGGARRLIIYSWKFQEILLDTTIKHKLALFHHSSFITSMGSTGNWLNYNHFQLLHHYAYGNIKTLAYKVTLDPLMAKYLDNNSNEKKQANENYAREFLELFTILKGPQLSVDNYTNYTEDDILSAAKVLTGFRNQNYAFKDADTGLAIARAIVGRHDTSDKQFSAAFNNQIITGAADEADMYRELEDFVDMVFAKKETARAYCRKLYRFFVSDHIDATKEAAIIEPLADQLLADNYEIVPTAKRLLKSQHFYDAADGNATDNIIGGKVKSGLDLVLGTFNYFKMPSLIRPFTSDPSNNYKDVNSVRKKMGELGYPFHEPETVEGYNGYYKDGFSCNWFTASSLLNRYSFYDMILRGQYTGSSNLKLNLASYFKDNSNLPDTFGPPDFAQADTMVNNFVTEVLETTLPELPIGDRFNYFRDALLNGLTSINFLFEWVAYKQTNDDSDVDEAFRAFFKAILNAEEYHTF